MAAELQFTKNQEIISRWYAVYTASRAEKKVKERLDEAGIENFLPVQTVLRQWKYRKQRVVVPVIPGMIFVRVCRKDQVKVLEIRGVVTYMRLRGSSTATAIPDKQMEDFRFLLDFSDSTVEMVNEEIEVGDTIRVIKGSLMGMTGELVHFKGESKILVRLDSLGCAMVSIPASYVETIKPAVTLAECFPGPVEK